MSPIPNRQSAVFGELAVPTFECPTCDKTFTVARKEDAPYRPFCCERCKMVDLGRWLDGTYSISEPVTPEDVEETPEDHD